MMHVLAVMRLLVILTFCAVTLWGLYLLENRLLGTVGISESYELYD